MVIEGNRRRRIHHGIHHGAHILLIGT